MKNFISGMFVGIANIIPGVSGGTMIVILGVFDKVMESISNVFKFNISNKERLDYIKFLFIFLLGAGVGLIGFAKILEVLFNVAEIQTLYCFIGLILFSLPMLKKTELKGERVNLIYLFIGIFIILGISYLNPGESDVTVTLSELLSKNLNITFIITLVMLGIISGATMIFPGVSGSMVLLVLGYYHMFKAYVANITSFEIMVLIPLVLIGIGVLIGIVGSAKITTYLLDKFRRNTMSLILGLIIGSIIVIVPTNGYNLVSSITSIVTFALGGGVILFIENKNNNK